MCNWAIGVNYVSAVAEVNGRLFNPDAFADAGVCQRFLSDTELARLYGPLDERFSSRVSALVEVAEDDQHTTADRLQATGTLLCVYRDPRVLDTAQVLIAKRHAEVLDDPNSRDFLFDSEAQAWHDVVFGMQYMGVLDNDVIGAYMEVGLVNGLKSSQKHASRALNQACHVFSKIQPRRLIARGGLKRVQVDEVVEGTCEAVVNGFVETFRFSEEELFDIVSGAGYYVRGLGQMTLEFASQN